MRGAVYMTDPLLGLLCALDKNSHLFCTVDVGIIAFPIRGCLAARAAAIIVAASQILSCFAAAAVVRLLV